MDTVINLINFLWGIPLTIIIILVGIYFSYNIKFIQITKFKQIIKNTISKRKEKNSLNTMLNVLGGTIGAGNVAGVASAIAVGGPGALFWMWIIALFSMATKMVEVVLAVRYQKKNKDGSTYGGPMYYMNEIKGKTGKVLSYVYAIIDSDILFPKSFKSLHKHITAMTSLAAVILKDSSLEFSPQFNPIFLKARSFTSRHLFQTTLLGSIFKSLPKYM